MLSSDPYSLIVLLVSLSLLPFVAMITTSYLKIVVVMSLIRNAMGIQSIPPNMVLNGMALIISLYIMAPTVEKTWTTMQTAFAENEKAEHKRPNTAIIAESVEPFREFLKRHASARHVAFFARSAETLWQTNPEEAVVVDENSFFILIPAFAVSELTKAFQIGFLIYLPFIAIDIIVSNILLAMGMMMVSPVTISLPFKLLLFVMVNGWTLLIQGLVQSYIR